ncbi:HflK protein [Tardibacter chloracetimidivorans]|uniref:Protein HflK n=1 Tax=Tardibacter chloracetimidivorans TaxID=1921510 RepID=A0A1L3ZWQ1_9SPHN|nr:FtsH protease activity modulator HflK [Tardibacter chloracetimidivorans]API60040.1 HflK protein [Tardibacter chloracetimidivorans]
MALNNEGGSQGPWGGSGGGDGGGPRNPWGNEPPRGPGRGNRPSNVDFESLIRKGQERLRSSIPGGGGDPRRMWLMIAGGLIALWIVFGSFYRVDPQERGVVMRFGKYVETTGPGMHMKLPTPIDTVQKVPVETVSSIDIGSTSSDTQNLMLTGDQNIIDIAYAVRWKIRDPERFLFVLAEPEDTIREVTESAMRAAISSVTLNAAIGPQRTQIADLVRERAQEVLDSYNAGVDVLGVDIKQADPPKEVDEAFKDVSASQQDAQKYLNDANAYAQQLTAQAQGEAASFDRVYAEYRLAPEVTRKRMYFETMENVLSNVDKTIVEVPGVQTYLPLSEVQRRTKEAQQ